MKTIARKRSTLAILARRISLTRLASPARTFSWVWSRPERDNRFNGLPHTVETVETVPARLGPCSTQLKQGVNERGSGLRRWAFEVFGLAAFAAVLAASTMLVVAGDPPLQPVTDPRAILQDLQRKMSALGSVCLDFTQERNLNLFTEPLRSEGVMLIERPDQIRWETTAPYQSILLGNHKSVAQFERTDGEWKKLKLGFPQMLRRVMEQMARMHQGQLDALTSDYTISVATGSVAVVTLVPKDETIRSMLSSLEIKMQPDFTATREVVMNEPSGELTRIIFRRERREVKFPPGTFDQAKPLDIAAVKAALGDAP
jgi:outer membrane lipoprotein-sorting protein